MPPKCVCVRQCTSRALAHVVSLLCNRLQVISIK
nr:MAG TPA: hypothetical protein [Caudoviricetes sp.]